LSSASISSRLLLLGRRDLVLHRLTLLLEQLRKQLLRVRLLGRRVLDGLVALLLGERERVRRHLLKLLQLWDLQSLVGRR
jgi:hypothetical protein